MNAQRTNDTMMPVIPDVEDVQERLLKKLRAQPGTVEEVKKKKLLLLVNWMIAAIIIAIPVTVFADEVIYLLYPSFTVYHAPEQVQWDWGILLFLLCIVGTVFCKLGVLLYNFVIEKFS
ncbi:MAG: hypothetical protein QM731_19185 [Chitinophagaceae bacterium]